MIHETKKTEKKFIFFQKISEAPKGGKETYFDAF